MTNRWGKVGAVTDFMFLGSKITVADDCSHEIKTPALRKNAVAHAVCAHLLPSVWLLRPCALWPARLLCPEDCPGHWSGNIPISKESSRGSTLQADSFPSEPPGKPLTNLDSISKSRDNTLLAKVRIIKPMVFPVLMYSFESWTIKKAEQLRTDVLELWRQRRLLRVPWTARRRNQSILKEINPDYLLEGLMLKLKLQYFGHLMWRANSLEKTLLLWKFEGRQRRRR